MIQLEPIEPEHIRSLNFGLNFVLKANAKLVQKESFGLGIRDPGVQYSLG